MKFILTLFTCFAMTVLTAQNSQSQTFPRMDASPMDLAMAKPDRNSPPIARVIYSRPQMKGREIFGELVPYGKVWRTGANEATELTIYKALELNNVTLQPGTYSIYTIPEADMWTVIINKNTNVWGTVYNQEMDVVRIKTPAREAAAPTESLSMVFRPENDGTTLMIGWEKTYVEIPFKIAK
ncbi:DUF2911 domain-containing protein [Marixanthomonas sp. SCSIO 43207]|uniref:DUF2911 domain-containing protein n=1 Tax=Marixanthomonas sp. SCSIO 43207 TaxID=2779360 RepID=UPI001CA8AE2E|nr:DUF2911 domain-containing protein [Marixanthomonas sp. SCSIO 43207]UAB79986.1 DUF2911 domain-containing protein [Marixanthomonas sp. SCSIO 43207]